MTSARARVPNLYPVGPLTGAGKLDFPKNFQAWAEPLSLLWCEDSRERIGDADRGWSAHVWGPLEMHPVPGTHMTAFDPGPVAAVANHV